jgi:hypothetical protein
MYLLDGACHRMRLTARYGLVKKLKIKWENNKNVVTMVKVGWERYGKDAEIEAVEHIQDHENYKFPILELNTPRSGGHTKKDRIERLEPDIRGGRFYLPAVVHHYEHGPKTGEFAGSCYWSVWSQEDAKRAAQAHRQVPYHVGQIVYRPMQGLTRTMREYAGQQNSRLVTAIKQKDENGDVYDLTRRFIEEMIRHPFAAHDDLIDATSRIYDIEPVPPAAFESPQSTESIETEGPLGPDTESIEGDDYDVTDDWRANRAGGLGDGF